MPLLQIGRHDNAALRELDRLLALGLVPAFAGGADQDLAAAGGGVVPVLVVAPAGLEGDAGTADRHLVGRRVGALQVRLPDEVLGEGVVGLAHAEHVGAVAGFLIGVLHGGSSLLWEDDRGAGLPRRRGSSRGRDPLIRTGPTRKPTRASCMRHHAGLRSSSVDGPSSHCY